MSDCLCPVLRVLCSYLVDVLALELGDELLETLVISIDTDGIEEFGDVFGAGALVSTKTEEEVCSEAVDWLKKCKMRVLLSRDILLHFEICLENFISLMRLLKWASSTLTIGSLCVGTENQSI